MKFVKFLISRLVTFILVVFIGVTTVFFIPRFMPSDPVEAMIGQMTSKAAFMDPVAVEKMRESLNITFGLDGTLWSQYTGFLKRAIFTWDFGPSLLNYPTPVNEIIMRALPWTFTLLFSATLISWILGNIIGLIAGFRKEKLYSKLFEGIAIIFYPIPYYIFALALIMVFAYVIPVFPLSFTIQGNVDWHWIKTAVWNSILPAGSLILTGLGWWVISMKTHVSNIVQEDYVHFARIKGLSDRKIMMKYVMPNAALPQVTQLALQIGSIFNGALITEILFGYPGLDRSFTPESSNQTTI